jgi:predicted DNA-binding protein (UPF0251 family)
MLEKSTHPCVSREMEFPELFTNTNRASMEKIVISVVLFCFLPMLTCFTPPRYPMMPEGVSSAWQEEEVLILSDSLDLEFKEARSENNLYEKSVIWYKINTTATNDLCRFPV